MLSEDTEERGILTPDEVAELFQLDWTDERSKIASILGAVSGMRLSEIVGLCIECVNMDKNVILVNRSFLLREAAERHQNRKAPNHLYRCIDCENAHGFVRPEPVSGFLYLL